MMKPRQYAIFALAILILSRETKADSSMQAGVSEITDSVAVLDFKSENVSPQAGGWAVGLEDYFELALERQNVPVLERRNIRLVLGERSLQSHGLLSAASLSQAKLPSVNFFVGGTLASPAANEFVLTVSVVQADKAEVVSAMTRRGTYPDGWLPAIESLAKDVNQRLQLPKPARPERSEFEMLTWLPEAALPFFKGLDYYSHGDYALAVPWFRHSYEKDQHFVIARRWEVRAYTKLNLPILAGALSVDGTNRSFGAMESKRPVAAVVASGKISAAGRAAFVQALAQAGRFEIFEPAAIGATTREIDLQLTGQMAAPLNERSVWLVVDDLIYLDAPDLETLVARQQNLLSGETVHQATAATADHDEAGGAALAKAFLTGKSEASSPQAGIELRSQSDLPEPTRQDSGEIAMARALRLAAANPQSARLWIGLADFYPGADPQNAFGKSRHLHRDQPSGV